MAEIRPAGKQKYPSIDFQQMNPIISNQSAVGACAMCRKTSRRCDRSIPICGRCTEKGLECGGYPEKFRFCGLASRGKWKNRDAPSPDVPSPLETRQVKNVAPSSNPQTQADRDIATRKREVLVRETSDRENVHHCN
jgi:hypothetical protein